MTIWYFPLLVFLDVRHAAHGQAAVAGGVGGFDPLHADNQPTGREIRPWHIVQQLGQGNLLHLVVALDQVGDGCGQFPQIVRGDVGRHTDGDPGRAVHQKIRQAGGQDRGLFQAIIKIWNKIYSIFFNIRQQLLSQFRQTGFGIAHGGGGIAIYGAEVTLAIHQEIAHREILRHAGHRLVDGSVAVGMIFSQHFADNARRFFVGRLMSQPHLVHGIENAPLNRFQAIARIRQSPSDDHAHCVIQVSRAHLLVNIH
jgi:hypothetical protein